jgi:hypothetical protein
MASVAAVEVPGSDAVTDQQDIPSRGHLEFNQEGAHPSPPLDVGITLEFSLQGLRRSW